MPEIPTWHRFQNPNPRSDERNVPMKLSPVARGVALTLCIGCSSFVLRAQEPTTDPSKATMAPAAAPVASDKLVLKEGTDVHLKFAQSLSSKTAAEGDPVNLTLDEDLKVGDVIVAKVGSKVVGTISHAKKAGMIGKAGELNMRLEYIILADGHLRLRGSKGKEGEGKEGTAVALTVLFGPIGLIKHGKEVEIKEGTALAAYTDENYTVPVAK
jgi:hypothetical protein